MLLGGKCHLEPNVLRAKALGGKCLQVANDKGWQMSHVGKGTGWEYLEAFVFGGKGLNGGKCLGGKRPREALVPGGKRLVANGLGGICRRRQKGKRQKGLGGIGSAANGGTANGSEAFSFLPVLAQYFKS